MVDRLQVDKCTTIKDRFCLGHMQRRTARVLLVTAMASAEEVERPTDHSPVWCCMWRARSGLFLPTHPASRKGQQTGDSHPRLFMRRPLPTVTEDEGSHRRHMARRLGLRRCGRRCGCGNRRGSQGGRRAVGHEPRWHWQSNTWKTMAFFETCRVPCLQEATACQSHETRTGPTKT